MQYRLLRQNDLCKDKPYPYPIITSQPDFSLIPPDCDHIAKKSDLVLVDLPGTLNTNGVFNTIADLDYVFVPMKADRLVMETTLAFAKAVKEQLVGKPGINLKGIYLFWTMIDRRERTPLYDQYENVIRTLKLPVLEAHLPSRMRFNKEINPQTTAVSRSTIFPPDNSFIKDCGLDVFCSEILSLIGLSHE